MSLLVQQAMQQVMPLMTPVDADSRNAAAWAVLARVSDPEVPALSLVDLGIVR